MKKLFLILLGLACGTSALKAQPETRNWRFGNQVGLAFPATGPPVAITGSALTSYEASTAASDGAGNLLCYASGNQIWNRNNLPMPNGAIVFGHGSATQGALLVPNPGNPQELYLFTVDAVENNLAGGLHYSVINMSLSSGLGDVGPLKDVAVPLPNGQQSLTEKLTAVPASNGRDYWIMVHGWNNNLFYSYLLTPAGLRAVPVVSSLGMVHAGGGGGFANAVGYMRASPDATRLAVAQRDSGLELFDFDNATGVVSNAYRVNIFAQYYYGVDFSADGTKLYMSDLVGSNVHQIDLSFNYAITTVGMANGFTGALLRGNDNRIYVGIELGSALAVVANPNAAGPACGFQARGLVLAGATRSRVGLPNFPGRVRQALAVSANAVCLGAATNFTATLTPAAANTQYSWNFGDPASGSANTATGISARHRYDQPGSYTVAVVATSGGGSVTTQVTATVFAVPVFSLAPRARSLCAGTLLDANLGALPAGTTLRWQDGLTTAVRPVAASGRYVLTLTSAQGCAVRDSVEVRLVPSPSVRLGADTVLCAGQVPLVLNPGAQPAGSTYLWQDGSGSPTFAATAPGVYRVEVRNAAGCLARGTVTVLDQPCPVLIPNIITPNGDAQNQAFKPTGLAPAEWALVVFNRWGAEVFRQEKYANGWEAAGQSSGLYFYLLTNAKSGRIYRGWVEVKR